MKILAGEYQRSNTNHGGRILLDARLNVILHTTSTSFRVNLTYLISLMVLDTH